RPRNVGRRPTRLPDPGTGRGLGDTVRADRGLRGARRRPAAHSVADSAPWPTIIRVLNRNPELSVIQAGRENCARQPPGAEAGWRSDPGWRDGMPELPLVGTELAGYGLRAVLGRGGMSIVYQAENPRLRNLIALKVLAPELADDQVFRTRFREESQIAASLNHPHVIPIHDFGSSDGLLYIAMRYVSGTDLRHLIAERGWLPPHSAVHLLGQAARALDAAHRRGLVHRDVKPGNLLIAQGTEDGDPDHVYLADFGITKYIGGRTGLTIAGTILGTVHYASPEQIQELPVLGTADQYALGCVFYECLTGRAPFEKSSNEAIMWAHVHEFAAPPSLLRPGLPPAVDEVFARVLAKDPDDRYADCREFIAAARAALAPTRTQPQDYEPPDTQWPPDTRAARGIDARAIEAQNRFRPAPVPASGPRDLGRAPVTQPPPEPTASVQPAAGPGHGA